MSKRRKSHIKLSNSLTCFAFHKKNRFLGETAKAVMKNKISFPSLTNEKKRTILNTDRKKPMSRRSIQAKKLSESRERCERGSFPSVEWACEGRSEPGYSRSSF